MITKTKKSTKKVEKFDYKTIKTFEDACNKLGIDPSKLPDLSMIPEEFRKPLIATYKLFIVFKAINDGWIADYSNSSQWKYYPWFRVLSSGFGFSGSGYDFDYSSAGIGSRLCTDTSEKALYMAKQFEDLYKDLFLFSE